MQKFHLIANNNDDGIMKLFTILMEIHNLTDNSLYVNNLISNLQAQAGDIIGFGEDATDGVGEKVGLQYQISMFKVNNHVF